MPEKEVGKKEKQRDVEREEEDEGALLGRLSPKMQALKTFHQSTFCAQTLS